MSNQCKHGQLGRVCEICELTKEVERLRTIFSPIEARARLTFELATMETLLADNPPKGADRLAQIIVAWSEETQRAEEAEQKVKELQTRLDGRTYFHSDETVEAENKRLREGLQYLRNEHKSQAMAWMDEDGDFDQAEYHSNLESIAEKALKEMK